MTVYHTSNIAITTPDIAHSRAYLDFGKGFYLTKFVEQARNYGQRFLRRGETAVMSIYELSDTIDNASFKLFSAYDGEWLDFISACRKGLPHDTFDIIEGGIADDQVFDTVDLYLAGMYTREQALDLLRYKKPNHQISITSQQVLDRHLRFINSVILT
ncbi:MAG: DUF3990 domain-containing protein [Prevotellaceae bacterium]|nr:DUF3990 domain-containing protein [Prevotellaceae bacterium]